MKPFSILVKPAGADCNLRCAYCFYLKKNALYTTPGPRRMTDAVLEQMVKSFLAVDQPQYSFGWQGGEPTSMGLDFFKRVTDLQMKYGRRGALVANGLQTNGTLLNDEWAKHLASHNFLVGVSLDGPPDIHDAHRRNIAGQGSHADVMRGIQCLAKNHVEFNILVLVNSANVKRPGDVYRYLVDKGFLHQQYIECVEFSANGQLMPFSINGEQWGEFLCGIYDEWIKNDVRRVSIRLFDSILTMMVDDFVNVCAMGRDCCQYFVVEHNGDIYPCDFFVERELKLGNVMETAWETVQASEAYRAFGRLKSQWNDQCAQCPYLQFCAGDCPKHRYGGVDRDARRISSLCRGWQMFYRHTLDGFRRLAGEIRAERARAELDLRRKRAADMMAGGNKPGRNDPCPCGSGKKFKKCCGTAQSFP